MSELKSQLENMIRLNNTDWCLGCGYLKSKCQCAEISAKAQQVKEAEKTRLAENLGGLRAYHEFTATAFDGPELEQARKVWQNGKGNLYLYGTAGCGKSHLATALIRDLTGARVVKSMDIMRRLRASEKAAQELEFIADMAHGPIVIDDLGVEKQTEFVGQTLYEILDKRWMSMSGGLIITSNLDVPGMAHKLSDDRILSRIIGMCGKGGIIKLNGRDRRLDG